MNDETLLARHRFRRIAMSAVGLPLALGLAAVLLWQTVERHEDAADLARLRLHQGARIAGDQVARMFETTDLVLVATSGHFAERPNVPPARSEKLHDALREAAVFTPQADVLEAFDRSGRLVAESRRYPPRDLGAADDAFFTLHRDGGAEFNIAPPERASAGGPWRIPLSRRVSDGSGEFAGVLRALISADQLSDVFLAEDSADIDRILMVGIDGRVYADSAARGRRIVGSIATVAFPMVAPLIQRSPALAANALETDEVLVAAYRLPDFPFRVLALRKREAVFADWRGFAWTMGMAAALVLIGSFAATITFVRQEQRRSAIEESLRLRERAIATVGNGVVITDALKSDDGIIYANPAFEALTGYAAAEVAGCNPRFLHGPESDQAELAEIRAALAEHREAHVVLRNYRKDGTTYWCDLLVTPVRDAKGRVTHHLGIQRDVTGQREAEQRMRKANEDLAASNAELEQFAYVASHDLQEPLRMVSSYVQLLERRYHDKLDDEAHEFVAFAVDGVKRMQELIIDLLEYSRITRRGKPFEPVNLADCLTMALADLDLAITESGAEVEAAPLPTVAGDAAQLRRVIENLVGNALKYRAPDRAPRIGVTAELKGGYWELGVADNGIGIDPEYHERIFVIFQRLHPRDRYPGTGIGLSVCRKIVERHGGRMWVDSADGQGSTFRFTLPAA